MVRHEGGYSFPLNFQSGAERRPFCLVIDEEGKTVSFHFKGRGGRSFPFREEQLRIPVQDFLLVAAKVLNTDRTPLESRFPMGGILGRRVTHSDPDRLSGAARSMRRRVEQFARTNNRVNGRTTARQVLLRGQPIRLRNAEELLEVSYDRDSQSLVFRNQPMSWMLFVSFVQHLLSDEVTLRSDCRFFFPWFKIRHENEAFASDRPLDPSPASIPKSESTVEDSPLDPPAAEQGEFALDVPNYSIGQVHGLVRELESALPDAASPDLDLAPDLVCSLLGSLRERFEAAGIIPKPVGVRSIKDLPPELRQEFADEIEALLETRISELDARERDINELKVLVDEETGRVDSKEAELKRREQELVSQEQALKSRWDEYRRAQTLLDQDTIFAAQQAVEMLRERVAPLTAKERIAREQMIEDLRHAKRRDVVEKQGRS